jgi:uncharacterized membrane protein (UPF0127 family)
MFMSIPIDVVYLDKHDQVIALDRAMKPWAIGKIYRNGAYVVEGAGGDDRRVWGGGGSSARREHP